MKTNPRTIFWIIKVQLSLLIRDELVLAEKPCKSGNLRINNRSKPLQQKLVKFTRKLRNSRIRMDSYTDAHNNIHRP